MTLSMINSKKEFKTAIRNGTSVIDFTAPWCAPCRLQEPILERIARRFENRVSVAALNVDNNPNIASGYGIQSIPTLIIFRKSKEVQRFVGLQPEAVLVVALKKLDNELTG